MTGEEGGRRRLARVSARGFRRVRATHRILLRTKLRRALYGTAILMLGYVLWTSWLPDHRRTVTTATARTERVSFVVTNRRFAAVPISGMRPATSPANAQECLEGLLVPNLGVVIGYERDLDKNVSVLLTANETALKPRDKGSPLAVFEPRNGGPHLPINEPVDLLSDRTTCEASLPGRFPIWGNLRLGEDVHPTSAGGRVQPGLLLEGRLSVQAKALEHWLLLPFSRSTVYPAKDIPLPFGARLEALDPNSTWWGTAYIDDQQVGLQVAAATEAGKLALYRPERSTPDVIEITTLTELFSDPNVVQMQVFAAVLLSVFGLCISVAQLDERT